MANPINDKLSFQEVLGMTKSFLNGEITADTFSGWIDTINVRSYIPVLDKLQILMAIVMKAQYSDIDTQEILVIELYRNIFFYLYLGGYLGIEITNNDISYESYDILEPVIGPIIEQFADRDIKLFDKMLHDTLDFYGINSTTELLNGIDYAAIQESTEANKKFLEELGKNADLVKDMKNIIDFNDPLTKKVVDEIKKMSVKDEGDKSQ